MSTRIVELINAMQPKSYLELGTWDGANFRKVECQDKVSVDINGKGTFTGTTDEFFSQNKRRFDVVFIDANHDIDYVVRDWNNSIAIADRAVVLHDMVPPTRRHTHTTECSSSFLLANYFIDNGIEFRALNHDCGLTVVRKEHFASIGSLWEIDAIDYDDFMAKVQTCDFEELVRYG